MEELAPLAQQKNIELGIDVLDDIAIVDAPPYLLRELVSNLIDNAIQHMKTEGTITVSLSQVANDVLLSVIDNGVGIPLTEQQKVFDRFYRLDDSKPNSSGLGLAIVKEIGDSLNATIDLKTPDNGIGLQVDVRFPKTLPSV